MNTQTPQKRFLAAPGIRTAWLAAAGLSVFFEVRRLLAAVHTPAGPLTWFIHWDPETTLPLFVLILLPVLVAVTRPPRTAPPQKQTPSRSRLVLSGLLVFGTSIGASLTVGLHPVPVADQFGSADRTAAFASLPPAYHDEYSYLLQARTFAAGRLSWPPAPVLPDLFHQYHVLNQKVTASRYFPLTGAWTALFLATGHPIVGHWLAGGLAAVFFWLAAGEFLRPGAALAAGLLIALSPGLAVFSNLLLSHHPTMLALSVFLWAMIRTLRTGRTGWSLLSGTALSAAMLGRPMTAAGFALPWGLAFGWFLIRRCRDAKCWQPAAAMLLPLTAGFVILGILNQAVTGSPMRTAYQEYTDTYTPRHTYGFNNGIRGDASDSPHILHRYNQWAENLTPALALRNIARRALASVQWSLGIIPIVFGLIVTAGHIARKSSGEMFPRCMTALVLCSIITLHAVHVPYWFDGIMHWHYVFETAPLLLILTAAGLSEAAHQLSRSLRPVPRIGWTAALAAAALLPGWVTADVLWGTSKVDAAIGELAWPRRRLALFEDILHSDRIRHPALVLVDERNQDPQLSYIINDPLWNADVLTARLPSSAEDMTILRRRFPNRHFYRFDPQNFSIEELPPP